MTLLPPQYDEAAWRKRVTRGLGSDRQASQLIVPQAWPAAPYGGAGPPDSAWYIPVTAGAFGTQSAQPWVCQVDRVAKSGFSIDIPWTTDASTTGEIRLLVTGAANSPSGVASLAAGSSGIASFKWLHGWPLYEGSDVWFVIEARRTGGAGNVNVGYPIGGGVLVGPPECTITGLAVAIPPGGGDMLWEDGDPMLWEDGDDMLWEV